MAESLIRSQRKWVDGDIFEKFWTKPLKSRRLDPAQLEKNPSKERMTRLGNCTMSSLPHKFEIKLFGVLEPVKQQPLPSQAQPLVQQPGQRQVLPQPIQHGASTAAARGPTHIPDQLSGTGVQESSTPPPHQSAARNPDSGRAPTMSTTGGVTQPPQRPPLTTAYPNTGLGPGNHPHQNHLPQHIYPPQQGPPRMAPQVASRPDPVIQSLAIRAASDPDLKALMRIVASGEATTEQLKIFQGHIDALTPVPQNRSSLAPVAPQQIHSQQQQQQHQQHEQQHQQRQAYPHRPLQYAPTSVPQQVQTVPKPKPFPQPPKQEITAVVFEFVDPYSQGDRFLFPKYTILEYLNNGMTAKASFLVVRKLVDDQDEYYQPMTVTLESASPRPLEILQKVVMNAEATCKYMKEVMATKKRADDSFLSFRLRHDPSERAPEKTEEPTKIEPASKGFKERKVKREVSTPLRDPKGSAGTPPVATSRPRVKTVKKVGCCLLFEKIHTKNFIQALPREPTIQDPKPLSSVIGTPVPKPPRPPKPPRSRKGRIADPTKSCHICQTSKTSLWRKADIDGENVTVCNACGIKWKTNAQKAAQAAAQVASGQPPRGGRTNFDSSLSKAASQQSEAGVSHTQYTQNEPATASPLGDIIAQMAYPNGYPVPTSTAASIIPGVSHGDQAYPQQLRFEVQPGSTIYHPRSVRQSDDSQAPPLSGSSQQAVPLPLPSTQLNEAPSIAAVPVAPTPAIPTQLANRAMLPAESGPVAPASPST